MTTEITETLAELVALVRSHPGIGNKAPIALVSDVFGAVDSYAGPGDDGAVVQDGDVTLVVGGEALWPPFAEADPYGAGVAAVLANVNDLAAMGARPLAIVDTIVGSEAVARRALEGMRYAGALYQVPIVGGHLTLRHGPPAISAFGLGRAGPSEAGSGAAGPSEAGTGGGGPSEAGTGPASAGPASAGPASAGPASTGPAAEDGAGARAPQRVLSVRHAQAGQSLIVAVCIEGTMRDDFNFFRSFDERGERLGGDVRVLATVAEASDAVAAKDISMAGLVGSLAMLLEFHQLGVTVDLDRLPRPAGVAMGQWLTTFPCFGFLLCSPSGREDACMARFRARGLSAAVVGTLDDTGLIRLGHQQQKTETVFDLHAESVTGLEALRSPTG